VVLDDDESIHDVWRQRFEEASHGAKALLRHISTPRELEALGDGAHRVFLVDFELLGCRETGLDLIRRLKIEQMSILVTSRADEPAIQKCCLTESIRLLPKSLAAHVPLNIERPPSPYSAVLVDDDPLIHMSWSLAATANNTTLLQLRDPRGLDDALDRVDVHTPIYVDYHLGGEETGDSVTRRLAQRGFRRIFPMTGEDAAALPAMPWLSGIVDKRPPSFGC